MNGEIRFIDLTFSIDNRFGTNFFFFFFLDVVYIKMFPFFWTKIEYIIGVIVDKTSQFLAIPFYQLEFIYAW